jgi:hypothetical protein
MGCAFCFFRYLPISGGLRLENQEAQLFDRERDPKNECPGAAPESKESSERAD